MGNYAADIAALESYGKGVDAGNRLQPWHPAMPNLEHAVVIF
jgi:hypothetical protein